jgi:hypothetical protein
MAVYDILLRYDDRDEVRLTDAPFEVGSTIEIAGRLWLVESEQARRGKSRARYTCVQLHEAARELRARSSDLIGRSPDLRDRYEAEQE